jgi:hypothetical protein
MDEANPHAQLVVVSDACHSGLLWRRMRASKSLDRWVFMAGANADQVATTDFVPALLKVLGKTEVFEKRRSKNGDAKWKTTWRVVYEALKQNYGGWHSDGKDDSSMARPLWTPADPATKPAETAQAARAEVACSDCAGGVCAAP